VANNKAAYSSKQLITTKADQSAPPASTAANITPTTITLNTMSGCEYRINSGYWQTSPIFIDLTPNTTYAFEAYKPETETHFASPTSPTAYIATADGPVVPLVLSVEISPRSPTVLPGQAQQFIVTVIAVGGADESVTWSMAGNLSMLTSITADGLLTVGSNEIAETISIKAVSNFDSTIFDEVTVKTTETSIAEAGNCSSLRVYPNPTSGELRVESGELRVESVEIFDVMGSLTPVPSPNWRGVSEGRGEVNISHLPPGIYFIRIQTNKGVVTRKVVKQ
jgi:hypothetical protein